MSKKRKSSSHTIKTYGITQWHLSHLKRMESSTTLLCKPQDSIPCTCMDLALV